MGELRGNLSALQGSDVPQRVSPTQILSTAVFFPLRYPLRYPLRAQHQLRSHQDSRHGLIGSWNEHTSGQHLSYFEDATPMSFLNKLVQTFCLMTWKTSVRKFIDVFDVIELSSPMIPCHNLNIFTIVQFAYGFCHDEEHGKFLGC